MQYRGSLQDTNVYRENGDMSQSRHSLVFALCIYIYIYIYIYIWISTKLKIKIYRTIILPVVLYGSETWSLTLREERKLRVLENMMLRRIFGPRRNGGDCITRR